MRIMWVGFRSWPHASPIGTFIDHGVNREFDKGITEQGYAAYQQLLASGKYKHITPKPGEILPIKGHAGDGDQRGRQSYPDDSAGRRGSRTGSALRRRRGRRIRPRTRARSA